MKLCPLLSINHFFVQRGKTENRIKQILWRDYICGRGKCTGPKVDLPMTKGKYPGVIGNSIFILVI